MIKKDRSGLVKMTSQESTFSLSGCTKRHNKKPELIHNKKAHDQTKKCSAMDLNYMVESKLDFSCLGLYGRATELDKLDEAYKKSSASCQVVWIKGCSGTGKSTLVKSAFKREEHLCMGKFERLGSPVPYSAFANLLSNLCCLLKVESDSNGVKIRSHDAYVLSIVLPEITNIVKVDLVRHKDLSTEANELNLAAFKQALRSFIKAACDLLKSPLIMFLDDLQWADLDCLDIIKDILTSPAIPGLLFVGSYRENEASEVDPLACCINSISEGMKSQIDCISDIHIQNLDLGMVNQLVADLLHTRIEDVKPLSELIHTKTDGNCYFTLQTLEHIHQRKLLYISRKSFTWEWQLEKIREEISVSDNVGEILCRKLSSLSAVVLAVLKLSAYLGTTVDMELLELLLPLLASTEAVISTVSNVQDAIKIAAEAKLIELNADRTRFKFSHDGVMASAYELIPEQKMRQSMHLTIGRYLRSHVMEDLKDETGFNDQFGISIMQLNLGSDLMQEVHERIDLANLNLFAARQVMKKGAFRLAQKFLEMGNALLDDCRWDDKHYDLTLRVSDALSSVLFTNGYMSESTLVIDDIYQHAKCPEDRVIAQLLQMQILSSTSRYCEGLDVGIRALRDLGYRNIPRKPSLVHVIPAMVGVKRRLKKMSDEDLLNLAGLNDTNMIRAIRCMSDLAIIAYFAGIMDLIPILGCGMMQILLSYGNSDTSALSFAHYGFLLTVVGDFEGAHRFSMLAHKLMERFGTDQRAVYYLHLYHHLKKPIHESADAMLQSYDLAFSRGDMKYASQACAISFAIRHEAGLSLRNALKDSSAFKKQLEKYNQRASLILLEGGLRAQSRLLSESDEIRLGLTDLFAVDDQNFEMCLRNSTESEIPVFNFRMYTMQVQYILGDIHAAFVMGKKCWRSQSLRGALPFSASYFFFSALTALNFWTKTRKLGHWMIARKFYRKLLAWNERGNPNTSHFVAFLEAEFMVVNRTKKSSELEIRNAYEKAIVPSTRCGFMHHAALANERAGIYFLQQMDSYWASHYLKVAKELYEDWGSTAKVDQMEREHEQLLGGSALSCTRSSTFLTGRCREEIIAKIEAARDDISPSGLFQLTSN